MYTKPARTLPLIWAFTMSFSAYSTRQTDERCPSIVQPVADSVRPTDHFSSRRTEASIRVSVWCGRRPLCIARLLFVRAMASITRTDNRSFPAANTQASYSLTRGAQFPDLSYPIDPFLVDATGALSPKDLYRHRKDRYALGGAR
jgi:hypothetical protein